MLLMLVALAMLWTLRDTPSGRALRRGLVERPAAWLSRRNGAPFGLALLALVAIVGVVHVFGGDGEPVRLVAFSVVETISWFIAFDVATWIEVYAVLWLLGASRQVRVVLGMARAAVARTVQALVRRPRTRQGSGGLRRKPPPRGRDEDPEPWGWRAAAAA